MKSSAIHQPLKQRYPKRGFGSMTRARVREIARLGGIAVSRDRERMAALGARGGAAPHRARKEAR